MVEESVCWIQGQDSFRVADGTIIIAEVKEGGLKSKLRKDILKCVEEKHKFILLIDEVQIPDNSEKAEELYSKLFDLIEESTYYTFLVSFVYCRLKNMKRNMVLRYYWPFILKLLRRRVGC